MSDATFNPGTPGGAEGTREQVSPIQQIQAQALEAQVVEVLRTCHDPEIPINIYELGLVYGVDVALSGRVRITMTLTSPACPVAGSIVAEVESKVNVIDGVSEAVVELVWDPPWSPERMSESARLELNL